MVILVYFLHLKNAFQRYLDLILSISSVISCHLDGRARNCSRRRDARHLFRQCHVKGTVTVQRYK